MNPRTKQIVGLLFLSVAGPGLVALSSHSTSLFGEDVTPECINCSAEKISFAPSGDANADQIRLNAIYAKVKADRDATVKALREKHLREMGVWRGTVLFPGKGIRESDQALYKSVCELFAADPAPPPSRLTEFAWCLTADSEYKVVGWTGAVTSVIDDADGQEVVLQVSPKLMHARYRALLLDQSCVETWRISKGGDLQFVKSEPTDPSRRGPQSVMVD